MADRCPVGASPPEHGYLRWTVRYCIVVVPN